MPTLSQMARNHSETMIERVAMALYPNAVDGNTGKSPDWALEKARAAIEAMREPTTDMFWAAQAANPADLRDEWQAMIDAALDEKADP